MKNLPNAIVLLAVSVAIPAAIIGAQQQTGTTSSNPFKGDAGAIKEGRALYQKYGCSGCHGLGGGGGMAVPVIDDVWEFGSDDQTLFKLMKGEIRESKMPRTFGSIPPDEIWKMLAYIRSKYSGDPSTVNW